MLSFLLKNGQVEFAAPNEMENQREVFRYVKSKKGKMSISDLIEGTDESGYLQSFFDNIFAL